MMGWFYPILGLDLWVVAGRHPDWIGLYQFWVVAGEHPVWVTSHPFWMVAGRHTD